MDAVLKNMQEKYEELMASLSEATVNPEEVDKQLCLTTSTNLSMSSSLLHGVRIAVSGFT